MAKVSQAEINAYIDEIMNNPYYNNLTPEEKYATIYNAANDFGVNASQVAAGIQAAGDSTVTTPVVDRYVEQAGWNPLTANAAVTPTQQDVNTYYQQAQALFGDGLEGLYDFMYNQGLNYGATDEQLGVSTGFDTDVINQFGFDKDLGMLSGAEDFTPTPNVSTQGLAGRYAAYDKRPDEGLTDYYNRLRAGRSGGILGTRDLTAASIAGTGGPVPPESPAAQGMLTGAGDQNGTSSYVPNVADGTAIDWENAPQWVKDYLPFVGNNSIINMIQDAAVDYRMGNFYDELDAQSDAYGDVWGSNFDPTQGLFQDSGSTATTYPSGQYMDFDFSNSGFDAEVLENGLK